jgi:hypothetical protein
MTIPKEELARLDADTRAMLRSRIAAAGNTTRTDDEATAEEWLGVALDALDEAEAATKQALATADGHREYGDKQEERAEKAESALAAVTAKLERRTERLAVLVKTFDYWQARFAVLTLAWNTGDNDSALGALRRFVAASDGEHAMTLLADLTASRALVGELACALESLVDPGPCSFDHHGNCQAHNLDNPCSNAMAIATLSHARKVKPQ